MFLFNFKINSADTNILQRMKDNIDCFLFKIALSYRQAVITWHVWLVGQEGR